MADRKVQLPQLLTNDGGLAELLFKDNGDGTFSLAVASSTTGASAGNVQGNVAAGVADVGNPVKVGGRYNSSAQSYTNGQRTDLQTSFAGMLRVEVMQADGATSLSKSYDRNNDTQGPGGFTQAVANSNYAYTGVAFDRVRVPIVFKTATATAAGDTAVWTPAASKKFRIMRYKIELTGNAAQTAAGVITVTLRDATTGLALTHSVYVPGAAGTTAGIDWNSGWIDLGNGILSAVANNVLNINLSTALTAGNFRVIACGTEE